MNYKSSAAGLLTAFILVTPCFAEQLNLGPQPAQDAAGVFTNLAEVAPTSLRNIDGTPLAVEDLQLGGISLGDSKHLVEGLKGTPLSIERGSVRSAFQWNDLAVRFIQETAYKYSVHEDLDIPKKLPTSGADAISVVGEGIPTHRGIFVGDSRENVLRAYGIPDQIFWDGPKQQMYMLYETEGKQLAFVIMANRVKRIEVTFAEGRFPKIRQNVISAEQVLVDEEFQIAGYKVGDTFKEYSWIDWTQKATNATDEILYFPSFGVRMDKNSRLISSLFINDIGMTTKRGISVGDQLSTLEALYGEPQKLEINLAELHPQSAYIYFSKDHRIALVFYIDETQKVVQNIVSMKNPQIQNPIQQSLIRIRDTRNKSHLRT